MNTWRHGNQTSDYILETFLVLPINYWDYRPHRCPITNEPTKNYKLMLEGQKDRIWRERNWRRIWLLKSSFWCYSWALLVSAETEDWKICWMSWKCVREPLMKKYKKEASITLLLIYLVFTEHFWRVEALIQSYCFMVCFFLASNCTLKASPPT